MNTWPAFLLGVSLEQSLLTVRLAIMGRPPWMSRVASAIAGFTLVMGLLTL